MDQQPGPGHKAIGLAVFLTFFVNLYVLPLVVELFFVPFMVVIVTMKIFTEAFKERDPQYANIGRVMSRLLVLIGFVLLAFAVVRAISGFDRFLSVATLKDFLVPPLLTILFAPFVYAVALYAGYELLFMRISMALRHDARLARRTKRAVARTCGLRLARLNEFSPYASRRVWEIEDDADLETFLRGFQPTKCEPAAAG